MSSIGLNLDPLFYGAGIALAVLLVATPLAWRALRPLPRLVRAGMGALACIGTAGLIALPFAFSVSRLEETPMLTLIFSGVLQGAAAVILSLLPRRA